MNKNSRIYIAGHSGFIGGAVLRRLKEFGYKNFVLRTYKQLDLTDQRKTERLFKEEKPEYVFLLAARVGGIQANSVFPAEFIFQNIAIQANVIHASYKFGVKKLLFLGSACMYPKFCPQPMKPEYLLTGSIEPTNEPFAVAKICGVKMCQAYNQQYKTNFISAVPATVFGPGDHFDANGHVVASLIRRFCKAKSENKKEEVIWGTGKPKRELLFINDAAEACIFLMKNYNDSKLINIGGVKEVSIKELAIRIKKMVDFEGKITYDTSKPDGMPRRLMDSFNILKLGFKPKVSLEDGLRFTCEWYRRTIE